MPWLISVKRRPALPGMLHGFTPTRPKRERPTGIPLSQAAVNVLSAQRGAHPDYVFVYRDKPVAKIKTAWMAALKRAEIDNFTWHGLRHTWAAWYVMSGTPLNVLQKLGGWADIKMVQQYAHLAPEYLARFADNAKPWKSTKNEAA